MDNKKEQLRALLDAMFDEGMSEQEILNTFGKTMEQKKEEQKKANEINKELIEESREYLIDMMIDYFNALGVYTNYSEEAIQKRRESFTETFKELEKTVIEEKRQPKNLSIVVSATYDEPVPKKELAKEDENLSWIDLIDKYFR